MAWEAVMKVTDEYHNEKDDMYRISLKAISGVLGTPKETRKTKLNFDLLLSSW